MTQTRCGDNWGMLDLLRRYTAQFDGAELGPDDEFLPHQPISADDAAELVRKWMTGSVAEEIDADGGTDRAWTLMQGLADDYGIPLDEFLGAIWFVAQHNGAYKLMPVPDQIGCAMGEVTRVLGAFHELTKADR